MHVLIIGQYFPPDIGGAATRAYNAAKGLALNGCKVTVLTAFPHYPHGKIPKEYKWKPAKVEWLGNIKVVRTFILPLESRGLASRILLFGSFAASSLLALPLTGKVGVIWAANPDILVMIPAMIYGKAKRIPVASNVDDLVIKDLYDLDLMKANSIIAKAAELVARISYSVAKSITPISPKYVDYISTKYSVRKSGMRVIRGGVDLSIFNSDASKQDLGKRFKVLYSGAFSIAYDFEQILHAAKIVREKDSEVEFVLQGKGELLDSIKSRIKELRLENVTVIDKVLTRDEVAELLSQADALLLPLKDFGKPYLGMSSKLYEYQAMGKPIICCAAGYPTDYVRETGSGIAVGPGDHRKIAEAVLFLKANPQKAMEMGRKGREYVENNVTVETIGLELKKVLTKCTLDP